MFFHLVLNCGSLADVTPVLYILSPRETMNRALWEAAHLPMTEAVRFWLVVPDPQSPTAMNDRDCEAERKATLIGDCPDENFLS